MKDNDIIKALECCVADEMICDKCPIKYECVSSPLDAIMEIYVLDLIKRQQAEIERLQKSLELVEGAKCVYSYDGETLEYCVHSPCPIWKTADKIKVEAVKEFAERLKKHSRKMQSSDFSGDFWDAAVLVEDIDNLVKEMLGE